MRVLGDVLVQRIHELPCIRLAPHLQPCRYIEKAGAARRRMRHHDLALVHRLGQILPGRGLRQVLLGRLDGVEADRRTPHVHPEPHRRVARVPVLRADRRQVGRGVRLQHAVEIQHHEAGRGKAHHDVRLWIGLLGHQLGRDHPGRVAYPFELDIRIDLVEPLLIRLDLVGLDRGVNQKLRFLRGRGRHP